jgi:single stranded DNA-binding protein
MFEQLILIGNLGGDPELRYTSSGAPVATFSLAVNRKWTNADGTPWRGDQVVPRHRLAQAGRDLPPVPEPRAGR